MHLKFENIDTFRNRKDRTKHWLSTSKRDENPKRKDSSQPNEFDPAYRRPRQAQLILTYLMKGAWPPALVEIIPRVIFENYDDDFIFAPYSIL